MSIPAEAIALLKEDEFPAVITFSQKFFGYCSVKMGEESHNAYYKRDNINSEQYRKFLFRKNAIVAVKLDKNSDGLTYKKYKDALQVTSARIIIKENGNTVQEEISVNTTRSVSVSPAHMIPIVPANGIASSQGISMMPPPIILF